MGQGGRPGGARALAAAGLIAGLLAGCGGHSGAKPVSSAALLSELNSTDTGSGSGYSSILVTSGHGTRHFVRAAWPRHLDVEMSCAGGRSVTFLTGPHALLTVYCAPGQSGGDRAQIGRYSRLTVRARPATRWSLVVAAGAR